MYNRNSIIIYSLFLVSAPPRPHHPQPPPQSTTSPYDRHPLQLQQGTKKPREKKTNVCVQLQPHNALLVSYAYARTVLRTYSEKLGTIKSDVLRDIVNCSADGTLVIFVNTVKDYNSVTAFLYNNNIT